MTMEASDSAGRLLRILRQRLSDEIHSRTAFTLYMNDTAARDASMEISDGYLRTLIENSSVADDLNIDLTAPDVRTVRQLIHFLNERVHGYKAVESATADLEHPSEDLVIEGYGDLQRGGVELKHRRFSDAELYDLLMNGVKRHNISYAPETVPTEEYTFVLSLAHAEALRTMATNGAKRYGLDASVEALLSLASSYESAYERDRQRQQRAIPAPDIREDDVGSGDIIQGEFFRRSLRTGRISPHSANLPPEEVQLWEPSGNDIGDTSIRLQWTRIRENDLYGVELWRDVTEDVARHADHDARGRNRRRSSTSRLVYRSGGYGTHYLSDTPGLSGFTDGLENDRTASPLEPDTLYYYRLYVIDVNRDVRGSNVIAVRTKAPRAQAAKSSPIHPVSGPLTGGTLVTLRGEHFHEGMQIRLGDKPVEDLTILDSTTATFATPIYYNAAATRRALDLVIVSSTGLVDVLSPAFRYVTP